MTNNTTREWDARTYDRVSDPQFTQGMAVVGRLEPEGVRVVLDAGCGTGRVTELILDRVPDARLIGVDGSEQMLHEAATRLAAPIAQGRVELIHGDLREPLPLVDPVDAIVSTATFHWIADHDGLFENLHAALVPGGQLVAQCGGAGCVDSVVEAIAAAGMTWNPWNFATAEDTSHRLQGAGFTDVRSWLHDEPAELEQGAPLREYLSTVILGSHLERLPAAEHQAFVENVASHIDPPVIDYVRLNVLARAG